MWQRTLLTKCEGVHSSLFGWSRYVVLRKYSEKKPENIENNVSESEKKLADLLDGAANFNEAQDTSWATTAYPEGAATPGKWKRPKQNPEETSIIIFPGQGTVKVGQVKNYLHFPRVKDLFKIANEVLGYNLLDICLKGPQTKLDRTEFNQAATVAMSLAAVEKLWEERPRALNSCKSVAGYSVGEISALVFAGGISIEDGIRLAGIRGAAMQQASDKCKQGMMSALFKPTAKIGDICGNSTKWAMDMGVSEPVCRIAIYLCPQTKIIAGNEEALQYIEKNSVALGLRRLKRLPVSGAFHTDLMAPAVKSFKKALDKIEIDELRIQVYGNVLGRPYPSAQHVKKMLLKQITAPVKWEQIMHLLYKRPEGEKFPRTFDMGSNGTMKSIIERVNLKAAESCIVI